MSGEKANRIRVLHIDDEPGFGELVAMFLERNRDDFDVVTATSAQEGMNRLTESPESIDCIVSDYDMPGMDGLELLERVREQYPDLPFILFTGRGSEEIASEAITAGVSEYLNKTSGTEQYPVLANRIDNLVSQYRAERELAATNERIRKLYSGLTDAIFALDTDRRFTHLNERAEELLGRSEAELIGEDISEAFQTWADTEFESELERAFTQHVPVEFEAYYPPLDVWHQIRAVPTEDGLTIHLTDVTEKREREREIQHQNERLKTIYQNLPIVLFAIDADGMYTLSKGQGLERTDLEPDEVVGDSVFERHAETPLAEDVQRALDGETLHTIREMDGRVFEAWHRPVEPEKTGGTIGAAIDITDRRERQHELEMAQARFRSLTENVGFSVITINEENVIQYANDAVEETFGYAPEEMVGQSLDMIVPNRLEQTHFEAVTRYLREGDRRLDWEWVELPARHRDGHEFPVGISFGEYVDDGEHIFTGVLRDITERKEQDRELQRQNDRLEAFASVLSHDLRTPLSVAEGHLDLARNGGDEDHLAKISTAHDRMKGIIEDVLTLAKHGETIGETQRISLDTVAKQAWDSVETDGADFTCDDLGDENGAIEADKSRLEQLFENLFRNAVEHGGADLTVRVGRLQTGFYVEDDGLGIPREERERVFHHNYSTHENGTGFGLAIVKRIVTAHGWSISIRDAQNGGVRFEITL